MDEFNPYAPPKSEAFGKDLHRDDPDQAWRDRKTLMVRKGAELPDRCLKCNAPAEGYRFSRTVYWLHSAWVIVFLISPLLYFLVYFIVRWKAKVTAGLCLRHRQRRARAIALGWLTALAGIGSFFLVAVLPERFLPIVVIAGVVALLAGLIGGMLGSQVLVPIRIDKNFVWLRKVSPEYLATFPDWKA